MLGRLRVESLAGCRGIPIRQLLKCCQPFLKLDLPEIDPVLLVPFAAFSGMPLLLTLRTAAGLLSCPKACIRLKPFPVHAAGALSILFLGPHISPALITIQEHSIRVFCGQLENVQVGKIFGGGWVNNSSTVTIGDGIVHRELALTGVISWLKERRRRAKETLLYHPLQWRAGEEHQEGFRDGQDQGRDNQKNPPVRFAAHDRQ